MGAKRILQRIEFGMIDWEGRAIAGSPEGVDPITYGFEVRCTVHLSYGRS